MYLYVKTIGEVLHVTCSYNICHIFEIFTMELIVEVQLIVSFQKHDLLQLKLIEDVTYTTGIQVLEFLILFNFFKFKFIAVVAKVCKEICVVFVLCISWESNRQ